MDEFHQPREAESQKPRNRPSHRGRGPRRLPTVSIIGAGNWGSALALALHGAGIRVVEVVARMKSRRYQALARFLGAQLATMDAAKLQSDVWWICTPDSVIADVARELRERVARIQADNELLGLQARLRSLAPIVFHSSGALSSAELAPLRDLDAALGSVHPLMTFPKPSFPRRNSLPHPLAGIPFAMEGDPRAIHAARRLIRAMHGEAFTLPSHSKVLYHAFGAFTSPLLVALLTAAVDTASAAGWSPIQAQRRMRPIVERTIANFFADGAAKSFSGPIARGDVLTIVRHLKALLSYPRIAAAYRDLSLVAVDTIPSPNPEQIRQVLQKAAARSAEAARPPGAKLLKRPERPQ